MLTPKSRQACQLTCEYRTLAPGTQHRPLTANAPAPRDRRRRGSRPLRGGFGRAGLLPAATGFDPHACPACARARESKNCRQRQRRPRARRLHTPIGHPSPRPHRRGQNRHYFHRSSYRAFKNWVRRILVQVQACTKGLIRMLGFVRGPAATREISAEFGPNPRADSP